jgi:predicted dehydrogenase/nucleoside-diphosphate-sugar epimerase
VAVVGAGYIAEYHLEILQGTEGVELVAVCDRDGRRAREAAERYGAAHAVEDVAELPALGVRVVHLLVPPDLHAALTRECLELGLGVFVEKPLALDPETARELSALADERGLPLAVNQNSLYHPAFLRLKERVARGDVGRLEHVQVTLHVPLRQLDAGDYAHWMFREPRNIVLEQGPHPFAQLDALLGPLQSLQATALGTRDLLPGQVLTDRWVLAARAERGTAEVAFHFGAPFAKSTLTVIGTDGFVEADLQNDLVSGERKTFWLDFWNSFLAGWRRGGELRASARRTLAHYLRQTLGLAGREDAFYAGMRDSIRAFHAAVRAGATPPVDGALGARVLDWCAATTRDLPAPTAPPAVPVDASPPRAGEVVVLGATGFIGRRVVERLVAAGRPVTAIVRRTHSLPTAVADGARSGDVRLVRASLEDREALRAAVDGADTVVHLATGGGDTWEEVERAMVQGSVDVAEAALDAGARRFVFVSSSAALYLGRDGGTGPVTDDVPTDPRPDARPVYARGKIAAEAALRELWLERRLPLVIARPAVVIGPGTPMQHSGIGLWVRDNHCVGWGPGDRPLPLVLADDVADALVRIVLHAGDELHGRALNLSARTGLTARDMLAAYREASGRDLHFHPRSHALSQAMEVGKWVVKQVGGRRDAPFPSWRDLRSRELARDLACETARDVLGWRPVEERAEFLKRATEGL